MVKGTDIHKNKIKQKCIIEDGNTKKRDRKDKKKHK